MGCLVNYSTIRCRLDKEELLCQLAEEAVELSIASSEVSFSSYTYCIDMKTGKKRDVMEEFLEEMADVQLVTEILLSEKDYAFLSDAVAQKKPSVLAADSWFLAVNHLRRKCLELAKAALKLRRVWNGKNPTPVTLKQAEGDFMEALSSVYRKMIDIEDTVKLGEERIRETKIRKADRWAKRLTEGVERDGNVQQDPEELLGNG